MSVREVLDPNTLIPNNAPPLRDKRVAHAVTIMEKMNVTTEPQFGPGRYNPGDVLVRVVLNERTIWEHLSAEDFDKFYELDEHTILKAALQEAAEFILKRTPRDAREWNATPQYFVDLFFNSAKEKLSGVKKEPV